jgi:hypothetical protein
MSSHQEYVQRASFELRNPTAEQLLVLSYTAWAATGTSRCASLRGGNGKIWPSLRRISARTDRLTDADSYRFEQHRAEATSERST